MPIVSKLSNRIEKKPSRQEGILHADVDNAYYQRCELLVNSSGALYRCVSTLGKFIAGHGYSDKQIGDLVINRKGWTFNQLLQRRTKDFARAGGWAMQVNYNALYKIVEINYVPFKFCRLQTDKDGIPTGLFCIYDDWGNWERGKVKKEKITIINPFNPDPAVIAKQVESAGGWQNYKGQLIWYSPDIDSYPLAPWDSEAESGEADFRIKRFKLRNISTGFMASYIYTIIGKMGETEKDARIEEIEQFQGDENAGNIMVEFVEREEAAPKLQKVDMQNNDKVFEWTSADTYERIRKVFMVPPVLVGDLVAGRMGTAREFADAVNMYNNHTAELRSVFQDWDRRILANWSSTITGSFEIKPLTSFTPVDVPEKLLNKLTTDEQRSLIGYGPIDKAGMAADEKISMQDPKVIVEILKTMSPDEVRKLFAGLDPSASPTPPAPNPPQNNG